LFTKFKFCIAAVLAFGATYSYAAEVAVLRNGNSIVHQRREVIGAVTRLYLNNSSGGYLEIPTDQIDHFESEPDPSPASSQNAQLAERPAQSAAPARSALAPQSQAPVVDSESLNLMVNGAGQRHQIDPDFINSVIRAESGFNNRAVSKKGAQGLMQLMPGTASQLGVSNAFDPNANVDGGTKYLRELLEKYNYDVPKALAAYNAGPGRVDRYRGVPPYSETQAYVARIIRDYNRKKLAENPSLAHKKKTLGRKSTQSAKTSIKIRANPAAANSHPAATETASR